MQRRGGKTRDPPELSPRCVSRCGPWQEMEEECGEPASEARQKGAWGRLPAVRQAGSLSQGRSTASCPALLCAPDGTETARGEPGAGRSGFATSDILDAASAGSGSAAGGVWHTSVLVTPQRRPGARAVGPNSHAAMSLIHKARQGRPSETTTSGPFYHSVLSHYT